MLGKPGAMALLMEAGSRLSIRDIDPLLSDDNRLAAAEAMLFWPFDKVRRDPVVDHAALHVKVGDNFRLSVFEKDDDVRRRIAGGQKLQTVTGCGRATSKSLAFALVRISSAVTGLSSLASAPSVRARGAFAR